MVTRARILTKEIKLEGTRVKARSGRASERGVLYSMQMFDRLGCLARVRQVYVESVKSSAFLARYINGI